MRLRPALLLTLGILLAPARAGAQVRPDLDWRTLRTPHFRVHFAGELEQLARRTAAHAEWAYERLALELEPPRGVVDIVVADNMDLANGYATAYPTNRIVVFARPPIEEMSLRNHADWNQVLVTHELAHIFHLDRTRGWWRLAQRIFGRAASTFPNTYLPSWLLEGLAVHYETKLTGAGRLAGTEFPALARAAALEDELPKLHELSLASPTFPGGSVAYLYGAFVMDRSGSARELVEKQSGRLWPWATEAAAREAFGTSFGDYLAAWSDSVRRAGAGRFGTDAASKRTLTDHRFFARHPRFVDDDEIIYVASDQRSTPGLYRLSFEPAGGDAGRRDEDRDANHVDRDRLARRNSLDVNAPARDDNIIAGELEYTDPYSLRSALYLDDGSRLFSRRRITAGARISAPDVHVASGRIVAIETLPGRTDVVMLDPSKDYYAETVAPGSLDRAWAEPRWSHDGTRIAASRWEQGGRMSIVVLDTAGRELRVFAPRAVDESRGGSSVAASAPANGRLAVVSSPVWVPGDTTILFVSDHEGRAMIYLGDVRTGGYARVWETATALHMPDVSPSGDRIAAVELHGDGYRVVTRAMPTRLPPLVVPAADSAPFIVRAIGLAPEVVRDTGAAATDYRGLSMLYPSWWLPSVEQTDAGTWRYGAITGARDVVGRHAWDGTFEYEPTNAEISGDFIYSWAGLGNPVITAAGAQYWQHGEVVNTSDERLGLIAQSSQTASLTASFMRPRTRLTTFAIVGGSVDRHSFRTYPAPLLEGLANDAYRSTLVSPSAVAQVGFSTMQRPGLAVSVEDGVAMSATHRARFDTGIRFEDVQETVVTMSAAKSLPLPGFARHVLAVRGAYGVMGHASTVGFGVGGVSGNSLEFLPGVVLGGQRRTFFVRGFDGTAQAGVRAAAGSVEYRAPLAIFGRGIPSLPFFFQKTSLTAFADAASAWCSFPVADSFACQAGGRTEPEWLASAGAELTLDAALEYDQLYRFRFGVARVLEGEQYAPRATTFYISLGSTF